MRTATWQKPHTFDEGVEFLTEHHIDYEVSIAGHHGALLTKESWLDSVARSFFVDEDGSGVQVTSGGALTDRIHPSAATVLMRDDTSYILWFNK